MCHMLTCLASFFSVIYKPRHFLLTCSNATTSKLILVLVWLSSNTLFLTALNRAELHQQPMESIKQHQMTFNQPIRKQWRQPRWRKRKRRQTWTQYQRNLLLRWPHLSSPSYALKMQTLLTWRRYCGFCILNMSGSSVVHPEDRSTHTVVLWYQLPPSSFNSQCKMTVKTCWTMMHQELEIASETRIWINSIEIYKTAGVIGHTLSD